MRSYDIQNKRQENEKHKKINDKIENISILVGYSIGNCICTVHFLAPAIYRSVKSIVLNCNLCETCKIMSV